MHRFQSPVLLAALALGASQLAVAQSVLPSDPAAAGSHANHGVAAGPSDECAGATTLLNGVNGPFNNQTATNSAPAWACGSGFGNDVWFTYRTFCSGTTTFSTCDSHSFDTVLEVFSGACGSLVSLGCNNNHCGQGSEVAVTTVSGVDYKVRVGGNNGSRGSFGLTVINTNCGTGGFTMLSYGCGAASISFGGLGRIGTSATFSLSGVQSVPVMLVGATLLGIPLCSGCTLGPSPTVVVPGSSLQLAIPQNTGLIGARISVQGADVGANGGCGAPRMTLTNTVVLTVS